MYISTSRHPYIRGPLWLRRKPLPLAKESAWVTRAQSDSLDKQFFLVRILLDQILLSMGELPMEGMAQSCTGQHHTDWTVETIADYGWKNQIIISIASQTVVGGTFHWIEEKKSGFPLGLKCTLRWT